jgi:SNF family Na+-dependent transporter
MNRKDLSLGQVLLVYGLGLVAGAQGGLYIFDTFDDSVSEPLSGVIALAFLALGFGVIAWLFRRTRADPHG